MGKDGVFLEDARLLSSLLYGKMSFVLTRVVRCEVLSLEPCYGNVPAGFFICPVRKIIAMVADSA